MNEMRNVLISEKAKTHISLKNTYFTFPDIYGRLVNIMICYDVIISNEAS